MAITKSALLFDYKSAGNSPTTDAQALASTAAVDDYVIVSVEGSGATGSTVAVSDSKSHTWTALTQVINTNTGGGWVQLFYTKVTTALVAGADTITATRTGTGSLLASARRVTGAALSSPLDGTQVSGTNATSNTAVAASAMSVADGSLVFAAAMLLGTNSVSSVGAGFTKESDGASTSTNIRSYGTIYQIKSGAGSVTPSFTAGTTGLWAIAAVAFKTAATPASGTAALSLSASGAAASIAAATAALTLSAAGGAAAPTSATASLSLSASGTTAGVSAGTASLSLSANSPAIWTDDFNRPGPSLGSDWVSTSNPLTTNGVEVLGASTTALARRSVTPGGFPLVSQVVHTGTTATSGPIVAAPSFASGATVSGLGSFYALRRSGSTLLRLYRYDDTTATSIASVSASVASGDVLRLEFDGTTLRGFLNGTQVLTNTPASPITGQFDVGIFSDGNTLGTPLFYSWTGGNGYTSGAATAAWGTGSLTLSASGSARATSAAAGTASLSLSGSGGVPASSAGAASLALSGSATGGAAASGSASLSLSGGATTSATAAGTATLDLSGLGTTGGSSPASGSASLSITASGAGAAPASGTASLSLNATGTAATTGSVSGSASLTLGAAGQATAPTTGSASLSLSAGGAGRATGAGAASLSLTAGTTGGATTAGVGTLTLVATADLAARATSEALLELIASGSAHGGAFRDITVTATLDRRWSAVLDPATRAATVHGPPRTATLDGPRRTATLDARWKAR